METSRSSLRARDFCTVNVTSHSQPPRAFAGSDQRVHPGGGVMLDADRSSDSGDGIVSFFWVQLKGSPVALSDPSSALCSFTAPEHKGMDEEGLLFRVIVQDGAGLRDSADVRVVVESR